MFNSFLLQNKLPSANVDCFVYDKAAVLLSIKTVFNNNRLIEITQYIFRFFFNDVSPTRMS